MEDYERQRMLRIEENRAKFEALGLPSLASAVLNSSRSSAPQGQSENDSEMGHRKRRCRGIGGSNDDGDDDYRPSDGSEGFSSSDGDAEEEEEKTNYKGKKKKKKRASKVKVGEELSIGDKIDGSDGMDDDDPDFLMAITLSLKEAEQKGPEEKNLRNSFGACSRSGRQEEKKGRKGDLKRPQMTKDELIAYFFTFDEAGDGEIRARDLRRVASAHDFNWTDKEMADMICLFDSNGDGKLSLEDFTKIISRCNMLKDH